MRRGLLIVIAALLAAPAAFAASPTTTTDTTAGTTTTATTTSATTTTATTTTATTTTATKQGPIFGLRAVGNNKLGYFVYPAHPGTVLHGSVIVTNTGDATGVVKIFAADGTTGATTGTVYLTDSAPKVTGSWIQLAQTELTLPPNKQSTVPFTVTVPAGAAAGEFVGGIVAETVAEVSGPKSQQKANVQIKVRNLSIVAVQVNLPGPKITKFTISKVVIGGSKGFQQVLVHVTNDGNVLMKPTGSVKITNTSGVAIQTIPFKMDTFLPHTSIDYPIVLKKGLPPGNYTANVSLAYTGASGAPQTSSASPPLIVTAENVKQVFTSSKPTSVSPGITNALGSGSGKKSSSTLLYAAIGGGAALLVALVALVLLLRRRGKNEPAPAQRRPVAQPRVTPPQAPASAPIAAPIAAPTLEACTPFHYWEVDWDSAQQGADGVTRYPHRCRNCGLQVLATDINDAAAQADALPR